MRMKLKDYDYGDEAYLLHTMEAIQRKMEEMKGCCGLEEMAETESDNDSWETLEESSDTEDQQDKKVRSTKRFVANKKYWPRF